MWKISLAAAVIGIGASVALWSPAKAQTVNTINSSTGFVLPNAPMPNGSDEVRTSDGVVCRSAMSGQGAYLDVGGVAGQSNGNGNFDRGSLYGRVVIPLGEKVGRIDCTQLYQLEIERLKLELQRMKAGLATGAGGGFNAQWNNN